MRGAGKKKEASASEKGFSMLSDQDTTHKVSLKSWSHDRALLPECALLSHSAAKDHLMHLL